MTLVALQVGIGPLPGGQEAIFILIFVILLSMLGRWIYYDAKSRGSDWAWQWGVGIPILAFFAIVPALLALLIYFYIRGERIRPSNDTYTTNGQ